MLGNLKNPNKFKIMSLLMSALYFYLFVSLLLFPEWVCKVFGIMGSESVYFLARRASTLMLGFSALLFLARNAAPSVTRQAIAFSVGLNMAGFALTGAFELMRGFLKASILPAIGIEVLIAAVYFSILASDRRHLRKPND